MHADRIRYGADTRQEMQLWIPPGQPTAVVLLLHGGGWVGGSWRDYSSFGPGLARHGVVAAAVGYRLADQVPWPACLDDIATAYDLLSERWGILPGAWGHSAGGHLGLMLATRRRLAGVVALSAPTDLTLLDTHRPGLLARLFAADLVAASPLSHAGALPATLMVHGARDRICPVVHAERLARASKSVQVDVVPRAGHGLRWPPWACWQARRRARDWLLARFGA